MKIFFALLMFMLVQNFGFGQLIFTGGLPDDLSIQAVFFEIDTLRINGDTTFYELSKFKDSVLVNREQHISISGQTIVFHGKTEQWYEDGVKKIEGKFELGEKIGLWNFLDEKGNLTQDFDVKAFGQESAYELIKYDSIINLTYQNNPDNLEPVNFNDNIENYIQSRHRLEKTTEQVLIKLLNDTSKFINAECGTPFYEGSFVFYSAGNQVAISFYACDKTQMYFEPKNVKSKFGGLTNEGIAILKAITN